jgi:hypothetical protein
VSRIVLALVMAVAIQVTPAETLVCWVSVDPDAGKRPQTATVCLIEGSVTDYGDSDLDVRLSPAVGTRDGDFCWYWTGGDSPWVLLAIDDDGRALLGYETGDGSFVAIDEAYPSCGAAPAPDPPPVAEAWHLLSRYDFPAPDPTFDPPLGRGLVGVEVFASIPLPEPWSDTLVSPRTGRTLDAEVQVDAVRIEWGDGTETLVPRMALPLLTGYPDGTAAHAYRTKTCEDPDGERCHPALASYPITVEFRWWARYRVDGGEWIRLGTEPTAAVFDYPVDEVIGVLTDVG